jgi:serine/threonine protein phosphatase PrpC
MAGKWRERVRGGAATRKKPTVARPNEDAVLCRVIDGIIGVFDGIGMYSEARQASQIARQACTPPLRQIDRERFVALDDALMAVGKALLAAQTEVLELQRQFPYAGEGGTTATIAKLWQPTPESPVTALFANIGDSRLYQWHAAEQRLERLTNDDNILNQWRDIGWIDEDTALHLTELMDDFTGVEPLPPAAQEAWDQRNTICAWLGMPDISFTFGATQLTTGDRLIATSDGIHDNLTTDELARIVSADRPPREIALHLIDVADAVAMTDQSPRAKPDDMSAAVMVLDPTPAPAPNGYHKPRPHRATAPLKMPPLPAEVANGSAS